MKTLFLVLLVTVFSFDSYSQKEVKLEELKDHIGDSVKVQEKISEVSIFKDPTGRTQFVLLILGTDLQNQLYVRINPSYAEQSVNLPGVDVNKKTAVVFGKVETLRNFLQIVVNDSDQLQILNK